MADKFVKVLLKNGREKEISARIANDENYQRNLGFKIIGEIPQSSQPAIEPQKKIVPVEPKNPVVEINEDKELTTQVETVSISETKEEIVVRLHKEGKSEDEIKAETGLNKLTIRKLIKNA